MPNRITYRGLGYDVIGMTAMPEAKLAREAEITYATIAMVTDFDCWHPEHDDVDVAVRDENGAAEYREGLASRRPLGTGLPGGARALPCGSDRRARLRHHDRACDARPGLLGKLDAVADAFSRVKTAPQNRAL